MRPVAFQHCMEWQQPLPSRCLAVHQMPATLLLWHHFEKLYCNHVFIVDWHGGGHYVTESQVQCGLGTL